MAFSQGSRSRIATVPEVSYGVTPGGPTMTLMRNTGTTLNLSKETFTSEEIRSDRQIEFSRHGNKQVGGDTSFEFAYGAFDTYLESALFSSFAAFNGDASGATTDNAGYAIAETSITLASAGTGEIKAGDFVTFAGDTNVYVVTTGDADVSNGGTIVLKSPGLKQAIPTSATAITVLTSTQMKAGTTLKSFTIERGFLDITQYMVFTGCVANTLALNVNAGQVVTGTIGWVGSDMTASGSQLAAPGAAASNDPFTAFEGSITDGGTSIATITGLTLNLANAVDPNFVIGSAVTPQLSYGRSNLTGTVTAFFEDLTLLNKFINETESAIRLTLVDPSANAFDIWLPRVKYNGGDLPVDSEQSLVMNMPFQALYDTTEASNIVLTAGT